MLTVFISRPCLLIMIILFQLTAELRFKGRDRRQRIFSIAMVTRCQWTCCVVEWLTFLKSTLRMPTCVLLGAVSLHQFALFIFQSFW